MEFDKNKLKEVGKIVAQIKTQLTDKVKENTSYLEIINFVEKSILSQGFQCAFPCTICVNEVAAHFTIFDEDLKFKKGDVVKVDFGACKDGFLSDTSVTIEIESEEYKDMIRANKEILEYIEKEIYTGIQLNEIGKLINDFTQKKGFTVIKNLSGHELKKYVLHSDLTVPNYDNKNPTKVDSQRVLAIEPFFTKTCERVVHKGDSNILELRSLKNTRNIIARKILNLIKQKYSKLPFSKRWIFEELGLDKNKFLFGLNVLKKEAIVYEHEVLVSEDNSVVTQFEETFVFHDNGVEVTTKENERSRNKN